MENSEDQKNEIQQQQQQVQETIQNNDNQENDNQDNNSLDLNKEQKNRFKNLKVIDTQINHSDLSDVEVMSSLSECSIRFGGYSYIDEQNGQVHGYDSEEVPKRSILKSQDSKDSKDFRNLKNIDGKAIQKRKSWSKAYSTTVSEISDDQIRQGHKRSNTTGTNKNSSDITFSLTAQEIDSKILFSNKKIPQNRFPSQSILKNSPLLQAGGFNNLKTIENKITKVKPKQYQEDECETGNIRFAGEIQLDQNFYQFEYDPQETPDRPILKRNSTQNDSVKYKRGSNKKKSYEFNKLKNIEGKVIKAHSECVTDNNQELNDYSDGNTMKVNYQSENENESKQSDVQFKGVDYPSKTHIYQSNRFPMKTILIQRRKSLDLRKLKKMQDQLDGKFIRRKSMFTEEKTVHFGCTITADNSSNFSSSFQSEEEEETQQEEKFKYLKKINFQQNQVKNDKVKSPEKEQNLYQNEIQVSPKSNQKLKKRRTSALSNSGAQKPILKKNTNVQITSPRETKIQKFFFKLERFRQEYLDNMSDLLESIGSSEIQQLLEEQDNISQFLDDVVYVLNLKMNKIQNYYKNIKNEQNLYLDQYKKSKFSQNQNNYHNKSSKEGSQKSIQDEEEDTKNNKIILQNLEKSNETNIQFVIEYIESISKIKNFTQLISEGSSNIMLQILQELKQLNLISETYFSEIYSIL